MVFFNYALRKLNAKIVYYGPGLCGKTTNLTWIHENFEGSGRGKMLSLATEGDRTIFFDLLPLDIGTVRGMDVTLQLYTVPGQVHYNATRQMVLKGADGVVFVADSQRAMLTSNMQSWKNLKENLLMQGIELATFPHVLQFNKRDLSDILSLEELDEALNEYDAPIFESVATTGIGVQETLQGIIRLVMRNLKRRYETEMDREFAFVPATVSDVRPTPGPPLDVAPHPGAEIRPFPGVAAIRPEPGPLEAEASGSVTGDAGAEEGDAVTHPVIPEPEAGDRGEATVLGSSGDETFERPEGAAPAPGPVAPDERAASTTASSAAEMPAQGSESAPSDVSSMGGKTPPFTEEPAAGAVQTGTVFEEEPAAVPFDLPSSETEAAWAEGSPEDSVFLAESVPPPGSDEGLEAGFEEAEPGVTDEEEAPEDLFMTRDIPAESVDELVSRVAEASAMDAVIEAAPEAREAQRPLMEEPAAGAAPQDTAPFGAAPHRGEEPPAAEEHPATVEQTPRPSEPVIFGSGDPFVIPEEETVPAVSASASAVVTIPAGEDIPSTELAPSANQLHVTLEGTQALARSGDVRELDITVPVPGGWIGNRRVTLQLRLTLVPADEEAS